MQKSYCEMTKYPEIFRETYWGIFKHDERDTYYLPMFENRNKFVEKFPTIKKKITKNKSKKREFFGPLFERVAAEGAHVDHCEYYDTGYSIIGISSHYCNDSDHAAWQKYGFKLIDPIYSLEQSTYMYEYFYGSLADEKHLKREKEMMFEFEALNPKKLIRK